MRLTIDRVLWGVVMLLYLVWRQRGWTDPKPLQAADKAALALVAYLARANALDRSPRHRPDARW